MLSSRVREIMYIDLAYQEQVEGASGPASTCQCTAHTSPQQEESQAKCTGACTCPHSGGHPIHPDRRHGKCLPTRQPTPDEHQTKQKNGRKNGNRGGWLVASHCQGDGRRREQHVPLLLSMTSTRHRLWGPPSPKEGTRTAHRGVDAYCPSSTHPPTPSLPLPASSSQQCRYICLRAGALRDLTLFVAVHHVRARQDGREDAAIGLGVAP